MAEAQLLAETVVRVAPLVGGPILAQRNAIRNHLVRAVLSEFSLNKPLQIQMIKERGKATLGLRINDATWEAAFQDLATEGLIRRLSAGVIELLKQPQLPSVRDLTEAAWKDFGAVLSARDPDKELVLLDAATRDVFDNVLMEIFARMATAASAVDAGIETLPITDIGLLIDSELAAKQVRNPRVFKATLLAYIEKPSVAFGALVADIYVGLVNYDLVRREADLKITNIAQQFAVLLADTNFLTALFCETDDVHALASAVAKRSFEMGIAITYTKATESEMKRLIQGAREEMRPSHHKHGDPFFRSQFIDDYLKRECDWADYVAELDQWSTFLQTAWNVRRFDGDDAIDDTDRDALRHQLDVVDKLRDAERAQRGQVVRLKNPARRTHDATMLAVVVKLRSKSQPGLLGPFFLTFDNAVATVADIAKQAFHQREALAIQPRVWLNYLLAFTPIEMDSERKIETAHALIRFTARIPNPPLKVPDYGRLLAPRLNLRGAEVGVLIDVLIRHPLLAELERALLGNDAEQADDIARSILADSVHIETIARTGQMREALRTANARWDKTQEEITQLTAERDAERAAKEALLQQGLAITVNTNATAHAEASATANVQIQGLVNLLRGEFPEGLSKAGLPEPPEPGRIEKTRKWLEDVKGIAESGSALAERLKPYLPVVTMLLAKAVGV